MMGRANELAFKSPEHLAELAALPDEELEAQGWTREELAVAWDARVATGQVPFYLRAAHDRHLAYIHRAPSSATPRAHVVAIPVAPQYQDEYDKPGNDRDGGDDGI